MSELPTIAILFMTKEVPGREGIALKTINGLNLNLHYEGTIDIFVCDGGSSPDYFETICDLIYVRNQLNSFGITDQDKSPGFTWNKTIKAIFDDKNIEHLIYLRMEDDFVLHDKLDITPYVRLLMEKERVGMVRLGLMPIGLDLHSTAHDGRIYFNVEKSTSYFYSGHPGLVHKRLHDAHGYFDETMNPGEIECNFDYRLRNEEGPKIWMPAELCVHTFGYFNHIGEVKSYEA